MFEIIPAIDLIGGRCVRLTRGDYNQETVYSDDPAEVARQWEAAGARRLHLVDLDGARAGQPCNLEVVGRICAAVSIPAQLGGGIRSIEAARMALDAGADRVIISTWAAVDPVAASALFNELREQAAVAVDSRDGFVAIKGWDAKTGERAVDFARRMQDLGARRIIFTNISRDGVLSGVDTGPIKEILGAVSIPVIAAGGVTTVEDVRQLKALENLGLEGAIIGKALYVGSVTLLDALSVAQNG